MPMRRISFPRRIGLALQKRRKALGISQENFAPQVRMDRVQYSKIERGLTRIRVDTLERLCLGLNARPWEVLKDADE
jgi:transcriptional regulator with XRE-family HTH domain